MTACPPHPDAIDLWTWSLDIDSKERARLYAFLSDDEKARVERFVHGRHARRFITARGGLRERLASYTHETPASLCFAYGAQGKPSLAGQTASGLTFNLSHSEGLAALGVTIGHDIGVDIEYIRPLEEDIAGHCFSPRECADLAALPPADRSRAFFQAWTRKEAFVKALGGGLSIPLDSFDVSLKPGEPAQLLRLRDDAEASRRWQIFHFEPSSDCIGALAIASPHCRLSFRTSTFG
ncbi:4'-phosphopantetheinyl transferase family protein [Beijerinckia indica]|uniref:4'-phosphopantetheinyl transferase n=1 Tax=Beijerinckia indica subsp. indica (strain ATCC 9039 / DSM 1715 / NCIMB 8712) TaxID=395963 RepID=B2IHH8_BEII9|nr:4'-phosphopantetheinyl transferase superfamily protein [Beijerinckia indica]ACB94499.1 4'-phosphopantetheinyl transferase [Beijerinckia indica subsp. indica ATCC 9039]